MAGWTAYKNLGRPASAVVHFDRYSLEAQTHQTQSKGDYWAGRAAEAARQVAQARSYYEKAGSHPDHFYGQLALEQLGRPVATPRSAEKTSELKSLMRTSYAVFCLKKKKNIRN